MRRWLTTMLLVLAAIFWAHGAKATCDQSGGGSFSTQWIEGGEMWGARVAAADPRWRLQESGHSNIVICETYDADQIQFAHFWLALANPADRDIDKQMSTELLADLYLALHMPRAEFRAEGDAQLVTIGGLEGKARKFGIRSPDGHAYMVIIASVARGCFGLVALASAADGRDVPLDRIGALASAIDIQRYGPMPNPCPPQPPDPRAPEDIPLLEQSKPPSCPSASGDGK
jgi:hypothetical protein